MKLKELMKGNKFSNELITLDYETNYSFEWDENYTKLSEEGEKKFAKLLESECKILANLNIQLLDDTITYEELEEFLSACAGYIPKEDYDKWFMDIDFNL